MEAKSMNSFEDREKSFEKKFAHDEELKFIIRDYFIIRALKNV